MFIKVRTADIELEIIEKQILISLSESAGYIINQLIKIDILTIGTADAHTNWPISKDVKYD